MSDFVFLSPLSLLALIRWVDWFCGSAAGRKTKR